MTLSDSRLQPAAAAKEDKHIRGERVRNRQKGEVEKKMREYETGLEGGV